jgi:oxygen-dependent protoporphyrinogen oxidase
MSTSPFGPKDVVIIGAGIAGLTAAYTLKKAGYRVLVLEKNPRVGGLIQTHQDQGYLCEMGPNTFLPSAKPLLNLVNKLGLESELIQNPDDHNRRYIFKNGRLQELVMHPLKFLKSPILSWRGKLRLLWEPFAKGPPTDTDESVADFISRRLGGEVLSSLVDPMVTGIIAGDTRQLSMAATFPKLAAMEKNHKSLFGAMRARRKNPKTKSKIGLLGFKSGMNAVCTALANVLKDDIVLEAQVEKIVQHPDRHWEIRFQQKNGTFVQAAPTLLIATPAYTAAALLAPLNTDIVTPLSAIPYVPVTVAHVGYRARDVNAVPGFGFLIPRSEKIRLLGVIWSSQIFQNRAPTDHLLMTTMYGGAADSEIAELSDNDMVRLLESDLQKTMGIAARPSYLNIRRHTRAIPQYTIGHLNRIDHIETILTSHPGLYLSGNYISGYSVSDTIQNATQAATKAAEYLTAHHYV